MNSDTTFHRDWRPEHFPDVIRAILEILFALEVALQICIRVFLDFVISKGRFCPCLPVGFNKRLGRDLEPVVILPSMEMQSVTGGFGERIGGRDLEQIIPEPVPDLYCNQSITLA